MAEPISNLERFKKDLQQLIAKGNQLALAMQSECYREALVKAITGQVKDADAFIAKLPSFKLEYQSWYSEAQALVKQLLPDRLIDFISHYQRPKSRKAVTYETYRIEDYLQGLGVTIGYQKEKVVGPDAAIPQFEQQLAILKAANGRFASSLYDMRQLVQADLFDSDLDAAGELAKKKFCRAAGALAGVVLEKHLADVCGKHGIKVSKKHPGISDLNEALKNANAIDIPTWRLVQHLADIRNLCDHNKSIEPTPEQVADLVAGVKKITKTLF
jgi:hypothetical protein